MSNNILVNLFAMLIAAPLAALGAVAAIVIAMELWRLHPILFVAFFGLIVWGVRKI